MEIKKVAVLGAGAVGAYVIWGLTGADVSLGVVAAGERAQRLRRDGLTINGRVFRPQVWSPEEARDADLLFVAVKYGALEAAQSDIRAAVGANTTVMSLMNGVDSEDIIAGIVGEDHVLPALIMVASHRSESGVEFDPESTVGIIYGEYREPFGSARVEAVGKLFSGTGIHYRATRYIREEIWSKFRLNVCSNLPQAMLGAGVGCCRDSAHMSAISEGLRTELEAIAAAKGIDLSLSGLPTEKAAAVPPAARYSTLQDLDAGRHTEIEMFSGVLIRMGRQLGVPTPYNEFAYHLIKALEEKNDGLFNYPPCRAR